MEPIFGFAERRGDRHRGFASRESRPARRRFGAIGGAFAVFEVVFGCELIGVDARVDRRGFVGESMRRLIAA